MKYENWYAQSEASGRMAAERLLSRTKPRRYMPTKLDVNGEFSPSLVSAEEAVRNLSEFQLLIYDEDEREV